MEISMPTALVILNSYEPQVSIPNGKRLILRTATRPCFVPKLDKDSTMYKCDACPKTFYYKKYLTTHEIRVHGRKKKKDTVEKFKCSLCDKVFTSLLSERKHRRNVHGEKKYSRKIQCQEEGCSETFPLMAKLRIHLQIAHNFPNIGNRKELKFDSKEDFKQWLYTEEIETKSHFISLRGMRQCKDCSLQVFGCNRSGMYKSRGSGKRQIKIQGSQKIGFYCTAEISVKDYNSHVEVVYFPEHYRHDRSLRHIPLSKEEKQNIAEKLQQGIDKRKILQDLRLSMNSDVERKHFITKKDLDNIEKNFGLKLSSKEPALLNDEQSVCAWVEEMNKTEFNPVLLYKRQDEDYPGIDTEDFIIVLMTAFQKTMLSEFNYDRICVVSLSKICDYNFELIVLFAADKYEEGVPIAFCITSSLCHETLYAFFQCVKDSIPDLNSLIFMSDDIPTFFNAWEEIFESCEEQFICSWYVDRDWRTHLTTIKKRGRRDEVYKALRSLMFELDEDIFNELLETFVLQLNMDEDSKIFYEYFIANYYGRSHMWAYCFRNEAKVDSEMHVATFYRSIKHSYVDRLKPKRVDECITKLINLVNDRKFAEFVENRKKTQDIINFENCYISELSERVSEDSIDTEWEILSESGDSYHISKSHVCDIRCVISPCSSSSNSYECVCHDYSVSKSTCRHINFLLQYINSAKTNSINVINQSQANNEYHKPTLGDTNKSIATRIITKLKNIQNMNNKTISQISNHLTSIKKNLKQNNNFAICEKSLLNHNVGQKEFFPVKKQNESQLHLLKTIDESESLTAESILQKIINS